VLQQVAGIKNQIFEAGGAVVAANKASITSPNPLNLNAESYEEEFNSNYNPDGYGTDGLFMSGIPPAITGYNLFYEPENIGGWPSFYGVPWVAVVDLTTGSLLDHATGGMGSSTILSLVNSVSTGGAITPVDFVTSSTEEVWNDPETGLDWEMNATEDELGYAEAQGYCDGLAKGGFDDWRLPTIEELRTIADDALATADGGDCPVTDDYSFSTTETPPEPPPGCYAAMPSLGIGVGGCYWRAPFVGTCSNTWSQSTNSGNGRKWRLDFFSGRIVSDVTDDWSRLSRTRCVRGEG